MQLIFPTAGSARILGRPVGDVAVRRRHRLPPREPDLLRLPDGRGAARPTSPACSTCPPPSGAARVARRARRRRARHGAAHAPAVVLEGHDPARRHRPGAPQRARGRVPRRADVGPRPARPPRRARSSCCGCATAAARCSSARTSCRTPRALCSQVAVIAQGRLAAGGPALGHHRRSTCAAGNSCVDAVSPALLAWLRARARARDLAQRWPLHRSICRRAAPERCWRIWRPAGARVVSLNPVRQTLEDYFVSHVAATAGAARRRAMSLSAIRKVAGAVFKESVRDRVPYSLVIFAVILMAASFLMSRLTAGQDLKVMKDLGPGDDERHRPAHRASSSAPAWCRRRSSGGASTRCCPSRCRGRASCVGKYVGLVLTLAVNLAMMTAAFYVMMLYMEWTTDDWIAAGLAGPGPRSAAAGRRSRSSACSWC